MPPCCLPGVPGISFIRIYVRICFCSFGGKWKRVGESWNDCKDQSPPWYKYSVITNDIGTEKFDVKLIEWAFNDVSRWKHKAQGEGERDMKRLKKGWIIAPPALRIRVILDICPVTLTSSSASPMQASLWPCYCAVLLLYVQIPTDWPESSHSARVRIFIGRSNATPPSTVVIPLFRPRLPLPWVESLLPYHPSPLWTANISRQSYLPTTPEVQIISRLPQRGSREIRSCFGCFVLMGLSRGVVRRYFIEPQQIS